MKIYILDCNDYKLEPFRRRFRGEEDVEVVCENFADFMSEYDVECIVSPANSFGLMDGGYDLAITEWFGDQLQDRVQQYIIDNFFGEQPVGTSFLIDAGMDGQTLIHTPTMRVPSPIRDVTVVYHCMRSTLICALKNEVESIVIPLFGGSTGRVRPEDIAEMMYRAYLQVQNPPTMLSWDYVRSTMLSEY